MKQKIKKVAPRSQRRRLVKATVKTDVHLAEISYRMMMFVW